MPRRRAWSSRSPELADLRLVIEAVAVIVASWILLGWTFDRAITQADGTVFWAPYVRSALEAGPDWTHHLYRFGVVGGSVMHDFAGTMPLVQLCALIGVSTTTTLNVVTVFVQLCFAVFGIKLIEALIAGWTGEPRRLRATERIVAIWAVGFAPILGWRLALGHENLLLGLVPFYACLALLAGARQRMLTATTLAFAAFAVANGVAGLGAQSVAYGAVFGAPLVVATLADAPAGAHWTWRHAIAAGALAAGVLLVLPRMAGMLAHAFGPDSTRGLESAVTYSYGAASWRDWLSSVPWTSALAARWHGPDALHEHNFPLGPLLCFVALAWPRGASRKLAWGVLVSAALALVLADDLAPLSSALLAAVPPLRAFRVPARAILPVATVLPSLALAALWARSELARPPWLAIAGAATVVVAGRHVDPLIREPLAWLACGAIAALARWRPARLAHPAVAGALAVAVALGVVAFDERFPRGVPFDPIEHGPHELHEAALRQAPELRDALERVEVVDPPRPYEMSLAFAAGLPSLDGVWYPPRRFLDLLSALAGHALPPTTCLFQLARSAEFPVLQQLYDVRYLIALSGGHGSMQPLPDPPGPAWFPARIERADSAAALGEALRAHRAELGATAWLLPGNRAPVPATCQGAAVRGVTTGALGQTATLDVDATASCALVVSTTYVTALHATAGGRELPVFPIDLALTGIAVPPGHSRIVLAPRAWIPWWSRAAQLAGLALLAAALVGAGRQRARSR